MFLHPLENAAKFCLSVHVYASTEKGWQEDYRNETGRRLKVPKRDSGGGGFRLNIPTWTYQDSEILQVDPCPTIPANRNAKVSHLSYGASL